MFSLLGIELLYAGRAELCQPAVGVGQVQIKSFLYLFAIMNVITIFGLMFILMVPQVHRREADQLLEDTFSSCARQ